MALNDTSSSTVVNHAAVCTYSESSSALSTGTWFFRKICSFTSLNSNDIAGHKKRLKRQRYQACELDRIFRYRVLV